MPNFLMLGKQYEAYVTEAHELSHSTVGARA
jgi:hypothetical protein